MFKGISHIYWSIIILSAHCENNLPWRRGLVLASILDLAEFAVVSRKKLPIEKSVFYIFFFESTINDRCVRQNSTKIN